MRKNLIKNIVSVGIFFAFFLLFPHATNASMLPIGNISTCGELGVAGEYTLTADVVAVGTSSCFTISADGVIINGNLHTITGSGDIAIDARAKDIITPTLLDEGVKGYNNLSVNNLTISGFTTGIDASGNNNTTGLTVLNGNGGDGGDVAIYYATIGSVITKGGNSTTKGYGGKGGDVFFNAVDLNISNSTLNLSGGEGTDGRYTDGGLDLNYTGTLTRTNVLLSSLDFFNDNLTEFGRYIGGPWPTVPGSVSSCGTLLGSGTYTLSQNLTSTSTCFFVASNNIVIDGNGYSITLATTSTTSFAIIAESFSNFTLASTTVTGYSNLINSSSSVTISGNDLDLSNKYISAGSLSLIYSGELNKASTTISALTNLTINGVSHGVALAGYLLEWVSRMIDLGGNWSSVASDASGTKLAAVQGHGYIYTSTDSGTTWTARMTDSNRSWNSIASSADGVRLIAAAGYGSVFISTNSGITWTEAAPSVLGWRDWQSVTSDASGTKLAAVATNGGYIYTSVDGGVNWSQKGLYSSSWIDIKSSSDGSKLVVVSSGGSGLVYTSIDSGDTWATSTSVGLKNWQSVTSDTSGTKLAAVAYNNYIYLSTNGGTTWATSTSAGSRNWRSITSSSDGTKLAAVVYNGYIYLSTDSGATWATSTDSGSRYWSSIASSADGNELIAGVESTNLYLYTYKNFKPSLSIDILKPQPSSEIQIWNPIVSWGVATSCQYSYDNFASTTKTANCSLLGSDIEKPNNAGNYTLYFRGIDVFGNTVEKNVNFDYTNQDILINTPVVGLSYNSKTFLANVDYSLMNADLLLCQYSYNNFSSTSVSNCSLGGSDITPPLSDGTSTLYIRTLNTDGVTSNANVTFKYYFNFAQQNSGNRSWLSITSSADGTKLAAAVYNGYVYTSTDSGVTWATSTASKIRDWYGIASDSSGAKLAAVVYGNGYIYTSTTSGATWATSTASGSRDWRSIASSADGTKLAAFAFNGYIYLSTNSGTTWATSTSAGSRNWYDITINDTGSKIFAVSGHYSNPGYIYVSTTSGATWSTSTSAGGKNWKSIASSADGTKIVAVSGNNNVGAGYVLISTDSGTTWATSTSAGSRNWQSVTSDSTGLKLAAAVSSGYIYTSNDGGSTWIQRTSGLSKNWISIASSADGNKLAAAEASGGYVHTLNLLEYNYDDVSIISPTYYLAVYTWSPSVRWGFDKTLCQYSYDNFVSTQTADCSLGGSDILPPGSGLRTLYIKAFNVNGVMSGANIIFYYYPSNWSAHLTDSNRNWYSIASSIDGKKIAAVAGINNGSVYTSTDSGSTWIERKSSLYYPYVVTSSADGTKLALIENGGYIWTSSDSGVTWTSSASAGSRYWISITSSADGTKLAAVDGDHSIWRSPDGGLSWIEAPNTDMDGSNTNYYWQSITSSADGTKLLAVANSWSNYDSQIYISTDSGVTWTPNDYFSYSSGYLLSIIKSSADGMKLFAATTDGNSLFTSEDGGVTWTDTSRYSNNWWSGITSSADGSRLFAVDGGRDIYTSTDSGVTWTPDGLYLNWYSISTSADGTKLAAGIDGGYLYTKTVSSPGIFVDIILPQTDNDFSLWNPIVSWGTATQCYYSYDGFTSSSTANCLLNGSDIARPSIIGLNTLSVKGIDSGDNFDTDSKTFTYSPYYWCGTDDSNWNNAENWYTTNSCSVKTGSVPGLKNEVILINSESPVINTSTTTIPELINSSGLTGGAGTAGLIFSGNAFNTGRIIGNATFNNTSYNNGFVTGNTIFNNSSYNMGTTTSAVTFNNTSYNTGTITGNAIFTTATSGTFTLSNSMIWGGTISGTAKGGDGVDITHLIFNDSSSNGTTILGTTSAVFNNNASNNGIINGDATFNNTGLFTMGTVNGTSTLNGLSQTLNGVNNVINFIKQVGSSIRDTLYFASGSTLNISGLTTILGHDANSLLTLRTTIPGASANLGINGTSNLNYLRIKDINNTGANLDLSSKTVYNDGGNSGFIFPSNSSPSQRGSLASPYTPPAVYVPPVVVPPTPSTPTNNTPTAGGGGSFFSNISASNVGKLNLSNIPKVGFGNIGDNLGVSNFVNPLAGMLQLKPIENFSPLPKLNFTTKFDNFLNNSLPKPLVDLSNTVPSIKKELSTANIRNGYDLYTMKESPINTPTMTELAQDKTKQPETLIFISVDGKERETKLSIDKKGSIYQMITVSPYDTLSINVKNTNKVTPAVTFNNQAIKTTKDKNNIIKFSVVAPNDNGVYILKVGTLTLNVEVKRPETTSTVKIETKKLSPIQKLWSWFTK